MRGSLRRGVIVLLLLTAGPALAVDWSALSAEQQRMLGRYHDRWAEIAEVRRAHLARGAERWLSMNAEQRRHMRECYGRWQGFSPRHREQLRQRFSSACILGLPMPKITT